MLKRPFFKYFYVPLLIVALGINAKAQDTIPFTLGSDNRIYIKVRVNDSEPLDFIFDTGASSMVVNTTQTDHKISLNFDSEVDNRGANGFTKQAVSSNNTLQIGKFIRKKEELLGIAYPKEHYSFDGVIGYPFFKDYLIEIDYKLEHLIMHRNESTLSQRATYESLPIDLKEDVPFIDMLIFKGEKAVVVPVMIDTGFNGELIVYHKMIKKHGLANQFPQQGTSASEGTDGAVIKSDRVFIPKATIGSIEFADLPAYFNKTPSPTSFTAILGGQILKEVHWILDFKQRMAYFKVD